MTNLSLWTIYDHPSDYPDHYVAREYLVTPDGPVRTDNIMLSADVERLRECFLAEMGLACLSRSPEDDPTIMEIWL